MLTQCYFAQWPFLMSSTVGLYPLPEMAASMSGYSVNRAVKAQRFFSQLLRVKAIVGEKPKSSGEKFRVDSACRAMSLLELATTEMTTGKDCTVFSDKREPLLGAA